MTRLENWSMKYSRADPYQPPEMAKFCLAGTVFGHPNQLRHHDGKEIATSEIVEIDKGSRTITTYSGTKYVLGKPDPAYLQWLNEEGRYHGEDVFPSFT